MSIQWERICPAIVLLALATGCATVPKCCSDFDTLATEIKVISVMPPGFTLDKVGAFSAETVSEMTHDIEIEVKRSLEDLVGTSKYGLSYLEVTDEALSADPELRRMLFDQSAELSLASKAIAECSSKTIDIDYTADIDYFADLTDCDYFIFVQGGGWFKTTGAKFKEAAVATTLSVIFGGIPSTGPGSMTSLSAYLVDATRGKVVWYNAVTVENRDPRKPSHLMKTCQSLMSPLLGKCSIKVDKSRDEAIIDKYKDRAIEQEPAEEEATDT